MTLLAISRELELHHQLEFSVHPFLRGSNSSAGDTVSVFKHLRKYTTMEKIKV